MTPRLASTVLLLRDAPGGGVEVFVQRRAATMKFAPGMTVFPGGGVDRRDLEDGHSVPWSGRDVGWWAEHLGVGELQARALVLAAVRETFEETGTLLVPGAATGYDAYRRRLEDRSVSMSGFFVDEDLTVGADLLRPWSNWVTPETSPIRYDTFFFLAAQPEGQEPDGRNTESVESRWTTPEAILRQWRDREVRLLPPTWHQLRRLSEVDAVAEALSLATVPVLRTDTDFLEQPFMAEYIELMGEPPWR